MSAMTDEEFEEFLDTPVRMRFWVCPEVEHRDRLVAAGMPVVTVEWDEHGIAHCTAPDCNRTNAARIAEMTVPNGCRHCGADKQNHCQRSGRGVGMHGWVEPTDAQRLARMKTRRAARAEVTARG